MSDLHDERIRELEEIIVAMPYITYRFETGNWPGTDDPLMPVADRTAAIDWLSRVNIERAAILNKRAV